MIELRDRHAAGHNIASTKITKGDPIRKYGVTIGFAATDIEPGTLLHSHNLEFRETERDYAYARDYKPVDMVPEAERDSFMGIVRDNGQVATRNYVGIITTVNCSATVAHKIAEWFTPERLAEYPNIDGVAAFAHGLGCERNQIAGLLEAEGLSVGPRLKTFVMQDTGGTRKTIEAGIAQVKALLPAANAVGRDVQINGKVSPGNNAGGLANLFEKSLGSSMKGGTGPLMEVYRYAEPVKQHGLVFMDTPGYDPVSATGQIAGGANMIMFTTGRGSMFGAKPVPSIKLATNTPMFKRLEEDMDINCGSVIDGELTMNEMGKKIFDLMLCIASGEKSKSEMLGLGDHEFVPWQIGITG